MEHLTGGKQGFRKLDRGYAIRKRALLRKPAYPQLTAWNKNNYMVAGGR